MNREPLIRVTKRDGMPLYKNILLRAVRRVDAGMADGQSGLTEAEQRSGQCCKEPDSKRLAETLQIHTTLQKLLEGE